MLGLASRFALLVSGVAFSLVMALLAFTPFAWLMEGRPDESYPEIIFAGAGLPSAVAASIAGCLLAKRPLIWRGRRRGFLSLAGAIAIANCICLIWLAFDSAKAADSGSVAPGVSFLIAPAVGVALLALNMTTRGAQQSRI
ncbi:MAG: hypothetical protein IIZ63_07080 [Caulobacteraceae bacterium]|nr:hypothetical protein [Caulobacteraceae bacterium]